MKVLLDLPDWAMDGKLVMTSNGRFVLKKDPGKNEPFLVAVNTCPQCGECCLGVGTDWPMGADEEGRCIKLEKDGDKWKCTAGADLPLRCMEPPPKRRMPECGIILNVQSGKING